MHSFGNTFNIQRGEDFYINFKLSSTSKNYVPYIVKDAIPNPFFVITIGTNLNSTNNDNTYKKSWWCQYNGQTFYQTQMIELNIQHHTATNIGSDTEDYDYIMKGDIEEPILHDDKGYYVECSSTEWSDLQQGIDFKDSDVLHKYCYFDIDGNEENITYFYFDYGTEAPKVYLRNYDINISHMFLSEETKNWTAKNYYYQITLVGGETMDNYISELTTLYGIDWSTIITNDELTSEQIRIIKYNYLKIKYNCFENDITEDCPLGTITTTTSIVSPKLLYSNSNIKTLI